ncbi:MAG: hypothetical protein P8L72_03925 [Flavobacteriaceae bacterium]|jgi:hypothetical protein|nr:hypothetical protein [Flavobacteriaceae bacterium]
MIYRFRIIFDSKKDDIFRDIEIEASATFEEFHNTITQAFGFGGSEMASFYLSDDNWSQGEEIALFDVSEGMDEVLLMSNTTLESQFFDNQKRLIYVYDFLSMWTFLIELMDTAEHPSGTSYPSLIYSHGMLPEDAPEKQFEAETENDSEWESENEDFYDDNEEDLWN